MDRLHVVFEETNLEDGMHLYDGQDISGKDIVNAEYKFHIGHEDNPLLCSLPEKPTPAELQDICTIKLKGYSRERIPEMSLAEKLEMISDLDLVYTPMWHIPLVVDTIFDHLYRSYKSRELRIGTVTEKGVTKTVLRSEKIPLAPRPHCFVLYGQTGTGKSAAIEFAKSLFPRTMLHDFEECAFPQIPILEVTASGKSTQPVYELLAREIDKRLDSGSMHYSEIVNKTPGKSIPKITEWIERYHIGMFIIDEAQFMEFKEAQYSVETLVTLMNSTGIAVGFVGNNELPECIYSRIRLHSRMGCNIICTNDTSKATKEAFGKSIETLWKYQFTNTYYPLTSEIKDHLEYISLRNISLLKAILTELQHQLVMTREPAVLTVEKIDKLLGDRFKKITDALKGYNNFSKEEFLNLKETLHTEIDEHARAARKAQELEQKKKSFEYQVYENQKMILTYLGVDHPEWHEDKVKRALNSVAKNNPEIAKNNIQEYKQLVIKKIEQAIKKSERKPTVRRVKDSVSPELERDVQNAIMRKSA